MSFPSFGSPYLYYVVILLQIVCILHLLRTGRSRDWLYLLIFLPLVGCIVYIIKEMLPGLQGSQLSSNIQQFAAPNARIKDLEKALRLADTDANRTNLAAAHAARGNFDKALELTQSCLKGIYADNVGLMRDMARYSFGAERYRQSMEWFDKVYQHPDRGVDKPEDELLYARALDYSGDKTRAAEAYKKHIRIHHSMEAMYYYGLMLKEQGNLSEARAQFQRIRDERDLQPGHVRRRSAAFLSGARKELAGLK